MAHYNLDMLLALRFRVRSPMAVRFRQWAAGKLKEYITKGFVLEDEGYRARTEMTSGRKRDDTFSLEMRLGSVGNYYIAIHEVGIALEKRRRGSVVRLFDCWM